MFMWRLEYGVSCAHGAGGFMADEVHLIFIFVSAARAISFGTSCFPDSVLFPIEQECKVLFIKVWLYFSV